MEPLDDLDEQVVRRMTELGPLVERRQQAEAEGMNPQFAIALRSRLLNKHRGAKGLGRIRFFAMALAPLAAVLLLAAILQARNSGFLGQPLHNESAPEKNLPVLRHPAPGGGLDAASKTQAGTTFYAESIPSPHLQPVTLPAAAVSASSHGLGITLLVKRRSYPRNALVKVTVRAANLSEHPIRVAPTPRYGACPAGQPAVRVQSADGSTSYAPGPFAATAIFCPDISSPAAGQGSLKSGRQLALTQYVVLRGPRLQGVLSLWSSGRPITAATPPLLLHQATAPAPRVVIHRGSRPYAVVTPLAAVQGPLLAAMSWQCRKASLSAGPATLATVSRVTPLQPANPRHLAPTLPPSCGVLLRWHAVVGWANSPVTEIAYTRHPQP
jgi:hypothetical protein